MTRTTRIISCVLVLALTAISYADDAKDMDGTWLPAEGALAGTKVGDELLKGTTLKIKSGTYEVLVAGQKDAGKLMLDSGKKPKTMDIKGEDGPNKGKTFLAIYELTGDTLKISYDLSGTKRPTGFESTQENKWFVVTYKRMK